MEDMELHEKIRYTREYRNKSRQELADYLGLSVGSIGHIETGIREVKPAILKEISKFLNVPWTFYIDEDTRTLEEFFEKYDVQSILANKEKYGGYFKVVDLAKDAGVTPEEFKVFLELRRKIKRQD